MVNEIEKVSLCGFGKIVSKENLEGVIRMEGGEEVFAVARSILNLRDIGARLGYLEGLMEQGEDVGYIFNSLAYQARGKDAENLAEYDVSVKSGGLEYEEALLDFVIK